MSVEEKRKREIVVEEIKPTKAIPVQEMSKDVVLVVDDDRRVLAMARAILGSVGYSSIATTSGEEALEVYKKAFETGYVISLVLLDYALPGGMNGVETLDALRLVDPNVRVIATSGYFDESSSGAARQRGFVGILPKPYTAERLSKVVEWGVGKAA